MTEHGSKHRKEGASSTERAVFRWQWSVSAAAPLWTRPPASSFSGWKRPSARSSGSSSVFCARLPPALRFPSRRALGSAASAPTLDELEALGLVVGQTGLEQHRVDAELRVQQRHVAVHLDEEVDALVPLVEMGVVV